jgi:hypothetical protein
MIDYTPRNWYWYVGGDQTQAYSSASGTFVPNNDGTFRAWRLAGNSPTLINSVPELGKVLADLRLRPVDVTVLRQYQIAIAAIPDIANFPVMLDLENRMRVLEGQPERTADEYREYLSTIV